MSERVAVTALPDDPVTEAVASLEMRWLLPGELDAAVAGWFSQFPAETQTFEDIYLLDPPLPGLSVKIRLGKALEVKAFRGSHGMFEVTGRARGALQSWQKWSFSAAALSTDAGLPDGWIPVHKTRHVSRFGLAGGQALSGDPPSAGQPVCSVELAEARAHGQPWWTLGFEATGPADTLRTVLQATAALVFDQPLPGQAALGPDNSSSYHRWLTQQANPGCPAAEAAVASSR
jgi:hypothetical protein